MAQLDGVFSMRTPRDLLAKLEHDFNRFVSANPSTREAQYAAFDFFVCAEHLADWVKHATGGSATQHRTYPDGPLVSHIANGAKHFRVDVNRHTQAKDTGFTAGSFSWNAFQSDAFSVDRLVIELEDGNVVSVSAVAARVLDHWKKALP